MKKTSKALASTAALCLVLSTSSVFAAENTAVAPERLAGANRVDTAIKIAEKSFNNKWKNSGKAILSAAADTNLVDSLAVAPLSYQLEAPILLNDAKDSINAETLKSLKDNKVKTVYIATGEGVISNKAKTQLEKAGFNVERLGGKNRYETAENILNAFKKNGGKAETVALVSGNGLADALSVAPEAAKSGMPILLTDGKDAVAANLAEVAQAAKTVYAIGGNGVISDALVQQLKADRVSGHSRYETNAEVIKKFAGDKEFSKVYIGNGQNSHLVDSLTGSVLAAQSGSPIVLADGSLADATKDALRGKVSDKTGVVALGGEAVVSDKLVKEVTDMVKPVEGFKIDSVKAITDTKISVKLSKAVDEAKASNFSIEGLTINSATLDASKKEVVLDVAGAKVNTEYTVKATGLKVDGKVMDDATLKFKMPSAESLFTPEVTMKDTVLKADGQSSTLVTFALKDANGNIMKDADKVEVAFTTTFGSLAEKKVTVQNGIATVLLTSETLDSAKTADITATVVEAGNKNLIGLKANRNLLMDPNPASGIDEKVGATMTEVQAAQADRVIVYFNKDISVEKYAKVGTHELDANKAVAKVETRVGNKGEAGKNVDVVGILPVQGNSKALQLVLKTPLTDNSNLKVEFTDKTGTLPVPSTKYCKLTDARKPAMLSVAREGLKTLKVTFSEPVDGTSANNMANWIIDGLELNNDAYLATAEVGEFNPATGEDTRNVVTIDLGKDAKGQRYFKSGTHSIQGANIGDWAEASDKGNNIMNTQTLDFDIPVDNTAPTAKVEVQSPEQYIVTFDKELNEDAAAIKNLIKLEKYNKDTAKWEAETKQQIDVKEITVNNTKQYKVEVKKDWTEVYDTKVSKQNYYNDSYRLVVDKDAISSAANGVKNAKMELLLEGAMKTPDVTSPVISKIVENLDANKKADGTYAVTMSEPVKGFDGLDTLAQGETKVTPTAQFIKKDGSKTVSAKVEKGADAYDKELKVTPESALEAGEWTVVVRSVSDDIGNTAASATKDFTVKGEEAAKEDKFAVVWSFADVDEDLDVTTTNGKDEAKHDYVYVKFNKAASITGDQKSALKTSNYQLNGMPLPTGTQIKANIANLDDKDAVTDSITIVLPDGYLNGKNTPHVITISNYLESTTAGDVLTNGGAKTLTWTADDATIFNASFAAEKLIYTAEKAAKEDLKDSAKLSSAEKAVNAAKTVNSLDAKTSGKSALEARFKAVEKTVQDARKVFDAKANLETAKTEVAALETAVAKDLTVEADLTTAVETAKAALDKLPAGTEGLAELTTRFNVADKKVKDAKVAIK